MTVTFLLLKMLDWIGVTEIYAETYWLKRKWKWLRLCCIHLWENNILKKICMHVIYRSCNIHLSPTVCGWNNTYIKCTHNVYIFYDPDTAVCRARNCKKNQSCFVFTLLPLVCLLTWREQKKLFLRYYAYKDTWETRWLTEFKKLWDSWWKGEKLVCCLYFLKIYTTVHAESKYLLLTVNWNGDWKDGMR